MSDGLVTELEITADVAAAAKVLQPTSSLWRSHLMTGAAEIRMETSHLNRYRPLRFSASEVKTYTHWRCICTRKRAGHSQHETRGLQQQECVDVGHLIKKVSSLLSGWQKPDKTDKSRMISSGCYWSCDWVWNLGVLCSCVCSIWHMHFSLLSVSIYFFMCVVFQVSLILSNLCNCIVH